MSIPYLNPVAGDGPNIYGAVRDFIVAYALPNYDAVNVIRGWQNVKYLPSQTNEYAVISIISHLRRGTTVHYYDAKKASPGEDGRTILKELVFVNVQVDCCSDIDDNARKRAQILEMVARSHVGTRFFKPYGIGCNYSTYPRDLTFIDKADQYTKRWEIELSLSYTAGVTVEYPWFDTINLVRVENVDAHHEPKNE